MNIPVSKGAAHLLRANNTNKLEAIVSAIEMLIMRQELTLGETATVIATLKARLLNKLNKTESYAGLYKFWIACMDELEVTMEQVEGTSGNYELVVLPFSITDILSNKGSN